MKEEREMVGGRKHIFLNFLRWLGNTANWPEPHKIQRPHLSHDTPNKFGYNLAEMCPLGGLYALYARTSKQSSRWLV